MENEQIDIIDQSKDNNQNNEAYKLLPKPSGDAFDIVQQVLAETTQQIKRQLSPVPPITLSFKDVYIWAKMTSGKTCSKKKYNKLILDRMSGQFKAGTSTAILGPSGCGKTTLLNFICARMKESKNLAVSGELFINGRKLNSIKEMKHRFSYVMQHDVMFEDFTAQELLTYSAKLAGIHNVESKVKEVIRWLSLQKCKDTIIGGVFTTGLSGGEKKRTSIALEVITDPSVIFLDEPTTGLDSKSALDVANIIKMLAENGRTIITTIHQPSSEILSRFDRILCLCEGKIIYDGPPGSITGYFGEIGYPVPPLYNPADHLMSILNDDDIKIKAFEENREITKEEVRRQFKERLDKFEAHYRETRQQEGADEMTKCSDSEFNTLKLPDENHKKSFCLAAWIITVRFYLFFFRNFNVFITKIMLMTAFAFFNMILYNGMTDYKEDTVAAIQDKSGMIFSVTAIGAFGGVFASVTGLIPTLPAHERENEKRLYSPVLYYVISTLYHLPSQVILNLWYQILFWFVIDIRSGFEAFWKYFLVFFTTYCSGTGYGDILSITIRDIKLINQLFSVAVIPFLLTSGFTKLVKDLILPLYLFSYGSFFRFPYQAGFFIEFDDQIVLDHLTNCKVRPQNCFSNDCAELRPNDRSCNPFTNADFTETGYWDNIWILLIQALAYRLIAAVIFWVYSQDRDIPYEPLPEASTFEHNQKKGMMMSKDQNVVNYNKNAIVPANAKGKILFFELMTDF